MDNELRSIENEMNKEGDDHYSNKMTLIKDKEFDELNNKRFEEDVKLQDKFIKDKNDEIEKFKQ